MKKILSSSLMLLTILSFALTATNCSNRDAKIKAIVKDTNATCPMTFNGGVFENVEHVSDSTIKINITILSDADDSIFTPEAFSEMLHPLFVQILQGHAGFKGLKDLNLIVIFAAKDGKGNKMMEVTVTPEEYNKPNTTNDDTRINTSGELRNNVRPVLTATVRAIKQQLPMTDKESGIVTADSYLEEGDELTMVTLAILPDKFIESSILSKDDFKTNIRLSMIDTANSDITVKVLLESGVKIKYLYTRENGDVYADVAITLADL